MISLPPAVAAFRRRHAGAFFAAPNAIQATSTSIDARFIKTGQPLRSSTLVQADDSTAPCGEN
jgi:hypothetical protein